MEPENLLKEDKYQVFLFACPTVMPFSFAVHPWFVVNNKGVVSRWGVSQTLRRRKESWGYLNLNMLPPFQGVWVWPLGKNFWKAKLLGVVEGDEDSLAQKMAEFIECSGETYPYSKTYSLTGPNSNTYVQWVIDQFPQSNLSLPWNSFGKNFIKKEIL